MRKFLLHRNSFLLSFIFVLFSLPSLGQTVALNDGLVLQPKTNRVGINIGSITFYDNGQLFKNLIGSFNPGFEPLINRQVWNIQFAGTANSFAMNNIYDGAPANYWAGGTFVVMAGVPGAPEDGCTGTIASNTGPNSPVNTGVAPVITFANSCAAALAPNDIITLTKKTFPTPESWWENAGGGLGGGGTVGKKGGRVYSDTTDLCATCGTQALTMDASVAGSEADDYYFYDGSYNVDISVLMNGNYQLSFWAKAVSGAPTIIVSAARLAANGFNCGTQTFAPTSTWAQYTWTCSANESVASVGLASVQIEFSTVGGVTYLDNVDWHKMSTINNPTVFRDEVIQTLQKYFASSTPGPRATLRDWTNQNGETVDNWTQQPYAHSPTGTGGGYYVGPTGTGAAGLQLEDYLVICQFLGVDPYLVFPTTASNDEGKNFVEFLSGSSSTPYGARRAAMGQIDPWTTVFGTIHVSLGNEDWNNFSFDGQAIYDNHVQPYSQPDYDYTLRAGTLFAAMRSVSSYDHTKFDLVMNGRTSGTSSVQSVMRAQPDSIEIEDYTQGFADSFDTDANRWGPAFVEPWLKATSPLDPKGFYRSTVTYQGLYICGYDGKQQCGVNVYEWGQGTLGSSTAAQNANTGIDQVTLDIINAGAGEGIVTALQPLLNIQYFGMGPQAFFSLDQLQGATKGNVTCDANGANCTQQRMLTKLWGATIDMGGFTNNVRPTFLGIQLINQSIIGPMFSCPINNNLTYTNTPSLNGNGDGTHANGFRTPQLSNIPYLYSFCFENSKSRSIVLVNTDLVNSHTINIAGNNGPTGSVVQRQYAPSNLNLLNEAPNGTNNRNAPMLTNIVTSTLTNPTTITLPAHSVTALDYTAASAPYTSAPTYSPAAGTYTVPTPVTMTSTPGATIYYTTDGSTPTTSSSIYSGPVTVAANGTLTAMAAFTGFNNSSVSSANYIIAPVLPTPTFSVAGGLYTTNQSVSINDSASGVTIYYTTDGTTPTTSSAAYTGPITVSTNQTLTAFAVKAGFTKSAPGAVTYVIAPVLAVPTFSPAAGTYASTQTVTLTAPAGATIYYAFNYTPTAASTKYTGPITVSSTETLQAIAVLAGFTTSPVASAAYTISGSTAYINYANGGFAASAFNLNNGAAVTSGGALQLTDGGAGENRSAWFSTQVPVKNFVTDFTFVQTGLADGMTFTIQGTGPTAIGPNGASLGYQGILKSAAVKFDLYSNAGEGSDSTGLYVNGAIPTLPSVSLTGTSINLDGGDVMGAHMVYDGTNLTLTLTDMVTSAAVVQVFPVNLPSLVGGNNAYVGFTGSTGGRTSTQQVLTWTYVSSTTQTQTQTAGTPSFTPAAGTYTSAQSVAISSSTAGSTLYYTTNGSTPTTSSSVYSGPITVSASQTVQAIAVKTGYSSSPVASAAYTINLPLPAPSFSVAAGTYTSAQTVTLSDTTAGVAIYYTIDGSTPTTSSSVYGGPITVSTSQTVQAIAVKAGYTNSPVASAVYSINLVLPAPTFSLAAGTYTTAQTVTLSDTTAGVTIYYTTNGATPTTSSSVYAGPITVSTSQTVQAIAVKTGYTNSSVTSALYSINLVLPAPTFSLAAGTYTAAQTVTLSDTTAGVTIYYTTNGATPTTSSSVYSGPIAVSLTQTVQAIAVKTGYTNSPVSLVSYIISTVLPAPTFSVPAGTYTAAQAVILTDATPLTTIYYTTDGTTPTTSSTMYKGAITVGTTETLKAIAVLVGFLNSPVATAAYTIDAIDPEFINVPSKGFTTTGFSFNGGASVNGGQLQLTDGGTGEGRSAWFSTAVPVQNFVTEFTFQQLNATADGMTFTIQGIGPKAVGGAGGGLGYQGISNSVAIKFDLYSNGGEGINSTGLFLNGANPTLPATDLGTSINLHSGHIMDALLVYDGTNLTLTLTDTVTKLFVSKVYPVNIPSLVGSTTAYVGFTGGTGGKTATQNVLSWTYSSTATGSAGQVATAPVFNPLGGAYVAAQTVTISDATKGAVIYYTTNGVLPTLSATRYTGPITVSKSETLQAVAVLADQPNSRVATAAYKIGAVAPAPSFSIAGGIYPATQKVTLSVSLVGATICFTTDGSTPTASSTKYTNPVVVSKTEKLQAIAIMTGYVNSPVASASYTISSTLPAPMLSLASGTYTSNQTLTITSVKAGAIIYFTVNGATPTTSSTKYTGPISITKTQTVKAIATATGFTKSPAQSATYTINTAVAAPTFSRPSGTYSATQTVTLTTSTTGATIYYTTNGATPTTASTKYTGPITISKTLKVQAIAVLTGHTNSPVAVATYTISTALAAPVFSRPSGTYTTTQTVTLTSSTAGATIYYTTNGTTPTTASTKYTGPITISKTLKVQAIAVLTGHTNSPVAVATYTISTALAAPVFSRPSGTYAATQTVTITSATAGATIYYTTNGATPTTASTKYTGPITVSKTLKVQAIAVLTGHTNSPVAAATYTISTALTAPVFSRPSGTYAATQTVTITSATAGATIYYTTNGATPTTASTKYTGPITISKTLKVQAIAVLTGHTNSPIAVASYTISAALAAPTFSRASGTYVGTQQVTITSATAGVAIYYTTNGTAPTTASTKYTGPITISKTEKVQAIAVLAGHTNSAVAAASYTISATVASPTFSRASGTYTGSQKVTISSVTVGAVIYYTINGTTPTTASARYTGPITVSTSQKVQAIAVVTGHANSAVAAVSYTIAIAK